MLSSNSETESAAAPFPAPADLFLPENPTAKQKIRFLKPIFSAEMLANPPIMLTLRKCRLRNRPPVGSGKLQAAKPSSRRERQIAGCETVLPLGAANCKLRKRPPAGSGKLQAAKISSHQERQIAAINRRGVSHTPEYIRNDKWAHSGRMRYAPTSIFTQ